MSQSPDIPIDFLLTSEATSTIISLATPYKENTIELAKLAVGDKYQGQGIGRRLTEAAIEWARARQFQEVILVSSTKLKQALYLYEKLCFSYGQLPEDTSYETADIYMEYQLQANP